MSRNAILFLFCLFFVVTTSHGYSEDRLEEDKVFAKVGEAVITVQDYKEALLRSSRERFYHRNPPVAELPAFQKEVADQLIEHELLLQEARRRNLVPDNTAIEMELDKHRNRALRNGQTIDETSDAWQKLAEYTQQEVLTKQLEQDIRNSVPPPTEDELLAYYQEHPDKFTEPEQFNLSTILLGVNPSSPRESWIAAQKEGTRIVNQLLNGADFAEMARLRSSDRSAENGGNIGYVHKGMLSLPVQEVINNLKEGEISGPHRILEGMVILKLHKRIPEKLIDFSVARQRAEELWLREKQDQVWHSLIDGLRAKTEIELEEKYLTVSGEMDK